MKRCLDTNVFIDLMRKRPDVLARMAASKAESFWVSEVVRAELLTGCLKSQNPDGERAKVCHLLSSMSLVPFGGRAVEHYAAIRTELEAAGKSIGANDLMIAATVRSMGAVLVTANLSEFKRVPGLMVESWREG